MMKAIIDRKGLQRAERIAKLAPKALDRGMKLLADMFIDTIKSGIEDQTFPFVPLSAKRIAIKARLGLDPRILVATGRYLREMRVEKRGVGNYAALLDGRLYKIHEFGTPTIPARPHVEPALEYVKKEGYSKAAEVMRAILGV